VCERPAQPRTRRRARREADGASILRRGFLLHRLPGHAAAAEAAPSASQRGMRRDSTRTPAMLTRAPLPRTSAQQSRRGFSEAA